MIRKKDHPSDYCLLDTTPEQRLTPFERLTFTGGSELERALNWISKQLSNVTRPRLGEGLDQASLQHALDVYAKREWRRSPGKFFEKPSHAPLNVKSHSIHGLGDGEILDISFPSTYRIRSAAFQPEYDSFPENKIVHARMWRHTKRSAATIVAVHGWTMGDQRINSLVFLPGLFYRLGLDVVLLELPYHGRRQSKDTNRGDLQALFPSAHISRTNEAMGQVISDLRELTLHLKSLGSRNIGVMGMSLGGYISALWASLDRLAFCIPIVPMVSMAELEWEMLVREPNFLELEAAGLSLDTLNKLYHFHCPLSYNPKVPRERLLIVSGIGDDIVPPIHSKLLWDHWKRPAMHWLVGGHLAQMRRSQAFGEIAKFLDRLGYVKTYADVFADSANE